ncbi:MAG: hypothetical protein ACERKN_07260 [Velocimicrobium sp.]
MDINLSELAGGALQEKAMGAIEEVVKNMQDPNTPWKNKREVKIALKFTQNENRDDCNCDISVEKKLASVKPVETKFSIGKDLRTGELFAEEYGPNIKGQMSLNDFEKTKEEIDEQIIDAETGEIVDFKAARKA